MVAPQTLAEARYSTLKANWGEVRMGRLAKLSGRTRRLAVDPETIEAVAQLHHQCRLIGHALHQRSDDAELWIAAAAIRRHLPLVAHDAVFNGCPRLGFRPQLGEAQSLPAPLRGALGEPGRRGR